MRGAEQLRGDPGAAGLAGVGRYGGVGVTGFRRAGAEGERGGCVEGGGERGVLVPVSREAEGLGKQLADCPAIVDGGLGDCASGRRTRAFARLSRHRFHARGYDLQ